MFRRTTKLVLILAVAVLAAAQFFQPKRTNPTADPKDSFEAVVQPPAEVASILNRSCRDCHSNQTVWPWYSHVTPVSWLVAQDVQEGRRRLNLSEWRRREQEQPGLRLSEICEQVRRGEMPLWYYLTLHPAAKLNETEVSTICAQAPERRVD
jgi:hypothetical protein